MRAEISTSNRWKGQDQKDHSAVLEKGKRDWPSLYCTSCAAHRGPNALSVRLGMAEMLRITTVDGTWHSPSLITVDTPFMDSS